MGYRYVSEAYNVSNAEKQVPIGAEAQLSEMEVQRYDSGAEGDWVLRYVFNDAAAITQGDCIMMDTDYASFDGIISTGTVIRQRVLGFAIGPIAAGEYGWVCKRGDCLAKSADGAILQGEELVSHSSGHVDARVVDDTAATDELDSVIAVALENDGATAATFRVKADIP